ncbi:hypothetical protein GQ53DRAFT_120830 [Thozetella sp. PMI_491]|nr:hypothetical protein GQ53DRAFT_120830 [Thozetella sp. PMI_491]
MPRFDSIIAILASASLTLAALSGGSASLHRQAGDGANNDFLPTVPVEPSQSDTILPPWWWYPPVFRYSSTPIEGGSPSSRAEGRGEGQDGPRNGTVWIFRDPTVAGVKCNFSSAQPYPNKVSLPPDVCLYTVGNNMTFLMNETAICPDGREAWLGLHRGGTCRYMLHMVNPDYVFESNICLTTGLAPPNSTHFISMVSMMFYCTDKVEDAMPAKLLNGDAESPVIEDPADLRAWYR